MITFNQSEDAIPAQGELIYKVYHLERNLTVYESLQVMINIVVFRGTSLSGYALLNASQTAAKDFDAN
jgi:hypothetical protein